MKKEPYFLNIAPMMPGCEDQLAADIADMAQKGIITHNAFSCTLTPEGAPMVDKAAILGERFAKHYAAVRKVSQVPCGILIQATIGHGWTPNTPSPGQKIIKWDGSERYIFCPLDPGFREYISRQVRQLSELKPDFFMLDDDFRMITSRGGCFCPLHVTGFNQLTGKNFTADSLRDAIRQDEKTARAYDAWLQQTMEETARIIRSAIDSVTPGIPCSFCMCANDVRHAAATGRILQGDAPLRIRINNGYYMKESVREIPAQMLRSALQALYLPEETEILDEPDTFPQNRYSTSAAMLHNHLTRAMAAGYFGAKLWITRMGTFEPESGKAYRKVLEKYSGFYRTLCDCGLKEDGILIPLASEAPFNYPPDANPIYPVGNWLTLTAVLGFPFHLNKTTWRHSGAAALSGDDCEMLSDGEIEKLLSLNLILDGSAALQLIRRGFGPKLGIGVEEWGDLPSPSFEKNDTGSLHVRLSKGNAPVQLTILPGVRGEVLSWIYHKNSALSPDSESERLAPGSCRITRPDGPSTLVMAIRLLHYGTVSFAYLSESRKNWLAEVFKDHISVYCRGDAEVMVQSGKDSADNRIVILHAMSPDDLEQPSLVFREPVDSVERLMPDGSWQTLFFEREKEALRLNLKVRQLYPEVLRIRCPLRVLELNTALSAAE
ncbi:MAG: hypothetical protein IKD44_03030 [Lentisphaeria bacterium]|nr:hypothetical protein [Lentisphaeria bacterium]